jgi:hypothetical protein
LNNEKLFCCNSAYRTSSFACSAIDARSAIDFVLAVACRNSAYRTFAFARTAHDASITNYISHNSTSLIK